MSRISTLNVINIEITELQHKQSKESLSLIDMKKLESLIKMRKDLMNTKVDDELEEVDEDIFSDEEILEFLEKRKTNDPSKKPKKG